MLDTSKKFYEVIDKCIDSSKFKQKEIAKELGYNTSNNITMIKQGNSRMALNKVPKFAKLMGEDPSVFVRKWMEEYEPEMLNVIDEYLTPRLSIKEQYMLKVLHFHPEGSPELIGKKVEQVFKTIELVYK